MLKRAIKLFFEFLFLAIMLFCLIWHDLVIYGISQGTGQLTIIKNAKPIEEVLNDNFLTDLLKQKLKLVTEIKKFAIDSLGINFSKNYSTFYDQHNKSVLLTVSACEPYSFKPKEWFFPFLGSVPYKGFFNREKARKEIIDLKSHGYDVDIYSPSGWSTLGWFQDPVLSNMLKKSDGELANLIIHELTHGTLYVKNNVTFNENLASFIGDKGAEQFLMHRYGIDSKQYIEYENNKSDEKCYNDYILKSITRLDSLYSSYSASSSEQFKKGKKMTLMLEIVVGVIRLPLHKAEGYFRYTLKAFTEKNAFFMAFSRYDSQYDIFDKEYKELYHSDLKIYLDAMKNKYPSL